MIITHFNLQRIVSVSVGMKQWRDLGKYIIILKHSAIAVFSKREVCNHNYDQDTLIFTYTNIYMRERERAREREQLKLNEVTQAQKVKLSPCAQASKQPSPCLNLTKALSWWWILPQKHNLFGKFNKVSLALFCFSLPFSWLFYFTHLET